jgi:hypothetical protein
MFEQTFTATQKTKRERAIALALLAQTVVVTGIGLLPVLGVEPLGPIKRFVVLPPVRLATEPLPPATTKPHSEYQRFSQNFPTTLGQGVYSQ